MPGLAHRNDLYFNGSSALYSLSANEFWSKHRDDVSYNQLQKFWSELSPQSRQELLRIDKQTLFEQARRNMYCSRCNGLLLEGFLQIVMYGKSLQQDGIGGDPLYNRLGVSKNQINGDTDIGDDCEGEIQDPSVHPWGGLTTTRDGSLTLMDCYLYSKTLLGLQSVFDSARGRERERELLYPDACGGGGRGWISQSMAGYGRGHGTREACALHTAKLSCDTLVDFWSALGEETRQSLLRMKEEDFIERLMYRFDSKRFCRDCRRNVIREFKELKELKRMRRETQCTSQFCVADTAFQYEVSDGTIQADWRQTFTDTVGTYNHFEWAVGTGEGKSDILEFENVGLNGCVKVNGLNLTGLSSCFITLRAWKLDGRCTELSVKAHALKGQQCVHCRLTVGDGFVTITRGDNIKMFFEHAEEAEEEEDDDSMDKDGNELDGECSRPQKHAKSPELAREFLLDAATVIFKEQVEKAFREGTARQNAHSIFVCLALKLLEERVHIACKEIVTLEKQTKLLEEEEKEKREEEERKERRRTKEREKKIRRKERLKGKEKNKDMRCSEVSKDDSLAGVDVDPNGSISCRDSVSELGEAFLFMPGSPSITDEFSNEFDTSRTQSSSDSPDGEITNAKYRSGSFTVEQSKFSRRRLQIWKEYQLDHSQKWSDRRQFDSVSEIHTMNGRSEPRYYGENLDIPLRSVHGPNRQSRTTAPKSFCRHGFKINHCSNSRVTDRYDYHSCSCNQNNEYSSKHEQYECSSKVGREAKPVSKFESPFNVSKQFHRSIKYNQVEFDRESCGKPKNKVILGNNPLRKELPHSKKVWEPMESQKKYPRSKSDSDVMPRQLTELVDDDKLIKSNGITCIGDNGEYPDEIDEEESNSKTSIESTADSDEGIHKVHHVGSKECENLTEPAIRACTGNLTSNSSLSAANEPFDLSESSSSNPDNGSSCPSVEEASNTSSLNNENIESSFTSDSEDVNQQSEVTSTSLQNGVYECHEVRMGNDQKANEVNDMGSGIHCSPSPGSSAISDPEVTSEVTSTSLQNGVYECHEVRMGNDQKANEVNDMGSGIHCSPSPGSSAISDPEKGTVNGSQNSDRRIPASQPQGMLPPMHNQNVHLPVFQASRMGYYHQNPDPWPAPAPNSGLLNFSHANHCLYNGALGGYGANGSSPLCMQYGPLQHLPTPMFNPRLVPIYPPINKSKDIKLERTDIYNPGGVFEASNGLNSDRVTPDGLHGRRAPPNKEDERNNCFSSTKLKKDSNSFSFFHFGGPAGLSTGSKSNPLLSEERLVEDFSTRYNNQVYQKETTIREYNLFAASQGTTFSFF